MSDFLVWNEAALRLELTRAEAPDLARRAIRVETAAKINASGRPGPRVRSGRLRASISWRLGEDAIGLYADIGSNVEYARFVEEGHPNTAHVFPILSGGGVFTGRFGYVSNRPTPAYQFLRPALAAAA